MKRVMALILVFAMAVLPALAARAYPVQASSPSACSCGEAEGGCPLCSEVRRQNGACPCAPAPQRQGPSQTDQDRAALSAQAAVLRNVARAVRNRVVPELPVWLVESLRASPRVGVPARAVGSGPPLRSALCVWTT
ncbi:MAG: hypothetical protein Q8L55_13540 [Phycisphaerales bacterium]|nr:hypothetical protein [Phycisphaerales bacterium]